MPAIPTNVETSSLQEVEIENCSETGGFLESLTSLYPRMRKLIVNELEHTNQDEQEEDIQFGDYDTFSISKKVNNAIIQNSAFDRYGDWHNNTEHLILKNYNRK